MGSVSVAIGGRTYKLSCEDGEEAHIAALAQHLGAKADALTAAIGTMAEPRLLLMAGLQVADELFEARRGGAPTVEDPRYAALADRVEAIAAALDGRSPLG